MKKQWIRSAQDRVLQSAPGWVRSHVQIALKKNQPVWAKRADPTHAYVYIDAELVAMVTARL